MGTRTTSNATGAAPEAGGTARLFELAPARSEIALERRLAASRRPFAVDLCCGRGGWTAGLVAEGWRVLGVDVCPQPAYPVGPHAAFVQADVRSLRAHELRCDTAPVLVVGSPPCQGFSTARAQNQSPPAVEAWELVAGVLRLVAELRPARWAIENVRGAWRWWEPLLGPPDLRDLPYYVWGNLPPAVRPQGPYPSKLRYRDVGVRSEVPAALAREVGRAAYDEWEQFDTELDENFVPAAARSTELALSLAGLS